MRTVIRLTMPLFVTFEANVVGQIILAGTILNMLSGLDTLWISMVTEKTMMVVICWDHVKDSPLMDQMCIPMVRTMYICM